MVAFANDVCLVPLANDEEKLMEMVARWNRAQRLDLAKEKIEAVILRGPRKRENIRFNLREINIISARTLKYLGVTLSNRGSFGPHGKEAARKTKKRAVLLGRLMPIIGGPENKRCRVLHGVIQSILLYGAPIWYKDLKIASYITLLTKADRKSLLRAANAYRTTSTKTIYVVMEINPIHLLKEERAILYETNEVNEVMRDGAESQTIGRWQRE